MDEKYKFFCEKCNYGTNVSTSYNKHMNTELHKTGKRKVKDNKEPDTYICKKCNYETKSKQNQRTHYLRHHSTKEERVSQFKYYCDKCDYGTFSSTEKEKHYNTNSHKINMCN